MKRSFLAVFTVFICCCVLCLTRPSFSATCSGLVSGPGYKNGSSSCVYDMHVTYYDCDSLAAAACNAAGVGCDTFSSWFYSSVGAGLPSGTLGYWRRGSVIGCDGSSDDIYLYIACAGGTCQNNDADYDGLPDDQDPCPTDSDCDDDGIPDGQDPCPENPNPDCTDPNEPNDPPAEPPLDPPDIPDDITVGDCTFDLTSFKEWLNTDSSFPFNLMFRFVALITPLFDLTPEPPVFDISIDASSISGRFSYIPSTISFSWDFTKYDIYAKILRAVEILSIVIAVVAYGLNSNKERP